MLEFQNAVEVTGAMIKDANSNHTAANNVATRGASTWAIAVTGLVFAVVTSLACFFVSAAVVKGMGWSLHPDVAGSTIYLLSVFFFELVFMPGILICLFVLILPFLYWLRKGSDAGPVSVVQSLAMLLTLEAVIVAFLLVGMESFGLLFALHFGLIAVSTLVGGWMMLKVINSNLDLGSSSR
jgi:hypothetical protein